jgi:hypothetical protein
LGVHCSSDQETEEDDTWEFGTVKGGRGRAFTVTTNSSQGTDVLESATTLRNSTISSINVRQLRGGLNGTSSYNSDILGLRTLINADPITKLEMSENTIVKSKSCNQVTVSPIRHPLSSNDDEDEDIHINGDLKVLS